jgi:hypothetical protein
MDNYQPPPEIQQGYPAFAHGSKKESSYVTPQSAPLLEAESGSAQHIGSGSQSLRRPTRLQRMGGYGISVLLFRTVAILLAFAFITFLWKGVNATTSWDDGTLSSLWRDIVVSGWATRVTTLSSLVNSGCDRNSSRRVHFYACCPSPRKGRRVIVCCSRSVGHT